MKKRILQKLMIVLLFCGLGTFLFSPSVFSSDPHAQQATSHDVHEAAHEEHGDSAAEGHHSVSWAEIKGPILYRLINALVFFGILYFVLRKPISAFLSSRRELVHEAIEGSAQRKARAEKEYEEYNRRLENIGKEIDELKRSLREEGTLESKKILEQGKKLAETIRRDAQLIAEADLEELKNELRSEVIETAALVAKETLRGRMNEADRERFTKEFVESLEASEDAGGKA
jgi:F-type H+-transporting ATPase subunit b